MLGGMSGSGPVQRFNNPERGIFLAVEGTGPLRGEHEDLLCAVAGSVQDLRPGETAGDRVATAYRQDAARFPAGLDGRFSAAVWEPRAGRLSLVDDLFGLQTLYYFYFRHEESGCVFFASKLAALLALEASPRGLSQESLALFLRQGYLPGSETLVAGASKLMPFEKLEVETGGGVSRQRYYRLPEPVLPAASELNVAWWAPKLKEEIVAALERSLVDGAPVAVFASGSVDSLALLSALRLLGQGRVRVPTVGYEGMPSAVEIEADAAAARAGGFEHEALLLSLSRLEPSAAARVFRAYDEPCEVFNRGPTQHFLTAMAGAAGLRQALTGGLGENVIGDMAWLARLENLAAIGSSSSEGPTVEREFTDGRNAFDQAQVKELSKAGESGRSQLRQMVMDLSAGIEGGSEYARS